ncbi:DUF4329 domain-containing protein [Pseudomonas sp. HN11]|uniref:DUF4329 domain-containing protein n=1 Tax=Pseudomonas sp. HN11 TaxID=1344094 RepID=UPI001F2D813B|nr:DUF4329 domain-containing protein [Pseudomonas sp. HN11]UII72141.1 DUF4329 domain-containing protein [Pseudomonas sp. HN11]
MDDSPPRGKRAAIPQGYAKLGPLTPAFISADDVARYLHERIGNRRAVEYGSVIMKRLSDGLYVGTEPVSDQHRQFDVSLILDTDSSTGEFIHPRGYRLVASLHSHSDTQEQARQAQPHLTLPMIHTIMSFFTTGDVVAIHQVRSTLPWAYLSGPDGTLLRYQVSYSTAEQEYAHWIEAGRLPTAPHGHDGTVVGEFKKLASVGSLRFLVSSAHWGGSVGDVPADWEPTKPFDAPTLQLPCGPVFSTRDLALNYAELRMSRQPDAKQRVLILRRGKQQVFVASEPQVAEPPAGTLPPFPVGFSLYGVYFHARPVLAQAPTQQSELYMNFVSPLALAQQIALMRHYAKDTHSTDHASLFIRTRDDAILRYRVSGAADESQLFVQNADGTVSDNGIQAQIQAGSLSPLTFVRRVATAGELSVIKVNAMWDTAGAVTAQWEPSRALTELALSAAFISADDAAHWAHLQIGSKRDKVYGGVILQRGKHFFATLPKPGNEQEFDFTTVIPIDEDDQQVPPVGFTLVAYFHSHPLLVSQAIASQDVVSWLRSSILPSEAASIIKNAQRYRIGSHYLSAAVDALVKYIPHDSDRTQTLLSYVESTTGAPRDIFGQYLPLLLGAGELWVLAANVVWGGQRGRVDKRWALGATLSGGQRMQPVLSAISQTLDIGSLLPLEPAVKGQAVFGYLLKAMGKEEYIATAPASERPKLTAPKKLFATGANGRAILPDGFRIEGIYCRLYPQSSWLHPEFFTPAVLAAVTEQLSADPTLYTDRRAFRLYLRTRDNALLSYAFSGGEGEAQFLGKQGATAENQLKAGTLTTNDFVMRLADIGQLTVLQVGANWPETGRVIPGGGAFGRLHNSLSPAFITADDAARYLHERIPGRSYDQLGYVLQRSDGLFVSTPPLYESDLSQQLGLSFDGEMFANLLMPIGYRIAGFFVALKNEFDIIKSKLTRPGESKPKLSLNEEATLYAAVPNYVYTTSITATNQKIPALYYSSPFNSLVKYVRSGSQNELNFSGFLREAIQNNEIKPQLDGFDGTPEEMVRKLVRVGEFSVVESSAIWGGSRGKLPAAGWVPLQPFVAGSPLQPVYSWIFQDAQSAARFSHDQMALNAGDPPLSFILKDPAAERYVVATAVTAPSNTALSLFSPLRVFGEDDRGRLALPSDFEIYGMCYATRPPLGLKIEQHWLYECFVSPTDLALAIAASREADSTVKRLLLSTRDGAQLEYVFSATGLEDQLYGVAPTGVVTDNGLQAQLVAGELTPIDFVKRIAAAGTLWVRQTGTLWDVEGQVGEGWRPFARYPTPVFSAPFLSADDAARFAHEQIGSERSIEQCGFILQTLDQRFVATLPLPCRAGDRFALDEVFAADHTGTLIVPRPYVLYGQYASCRALSLMDTARMSHYGWSRTEASVEWQLFTDPELHRLIGNRHVVSVAYLSSAEDALLAYDLSGSAAELALRAELAPGPQGSQLDRQRVRGQLRPEAMVRKLATTGLRIAQGNRLWGAAGTLPDHWQAIPAEKAFERPAQVAFGAIFSSATRAVEDAHARLKRGCGSSQTGFGFVLKHAHKDEYVVSEIVPSDGSHPLFSLASLFKTAEDGAYVYPSGFTLKGLFYARRWMPEQLPKHERWLAQHFISSADLYSSFLIAKQQREEDAVTTLPVFISTLDNALLKYQTPLSTRLFDAQKQPSGNFEDVHTRLAGGQLTAQAFVTQVISLCWLSVMVPNDCWDETGKLGTDWVPYANFSRRALSPAFFSMDDALRYTRTLTATQPNQIEGGLVLRRVDGLYVATEPLPVTTENFDPKSILPDEDVRQDWLAPGMKIVARYRSRRDTWPDFPLSEEALKVYRNMFSTDVLAKALDCNHLWSHEYLFGLDGSVISFTCNDLNRDLLSAEQQQQETLDFQQLKVDLAPAAQTPHDPQSNVIQQHLRDGVKTPTEFINRVLKVATMSVVQGSQLWGNPQLLPRGWFPAHGFTVPESSTHASADRACSPVFHHVDDVARFVHELAGERDELTFGVLLKSTNERWMACLPVKGEDLQFPLSRVFLSGQLPLGWTLQGLYLCAPARQPDELITSPVYRSFIPPSVLRAVLWALRQGEQYLPLYLSCADGALLSYRAAFIDSDWDSQSRLQAYVEKLNGDFNPADYIHQVARSGALEVLITGDIWAAQGPVGSTWRPRQVTPYTPGNDERVALGPLFAHADDAARYQWRRYRHAPTQPRLAALLANAADNTFLVTDPLDDSGLSVGWGRPDTAAMDRLFSSYINPEYLKRHSRYPHGYRIMGVQQLYKLTAPRSQKNRYQQALADNFVGQPEFRTFVSMFRDNRVAGARYYFTPRNGALLVYLPSFEPAETDMLFSGWIDPTSQEPLATPSQVITTLVHSGRLYVLEPDTFWQPRGHVQTRLLQALRKTYR